MGSPTAVGVSIYAGGHALGVKRAGFDIRAHLEEATFGVDTFKLNFPETPVHLPYSEWPMRFAGETPDWVYSNPPCAPWSRAGGSMQGGRDHWRSDPRVEHTLHSFEMLSRYRPKVWSWESVETTYSLGEDLIDELTDKALAMGYSVTYLLTDGQLHGLPQRRRRFFMVVHSVAIPWTKPTGPSVTVEQALAGLEPGWHGQMSDEWRGVVSVLKPGQYLRAKWEELNEVKTGYGVRVAGRPPYTIHRIRGNQVCSTITSMRSQLHWLENRYLGNTEIFKLLGYPNDYKWAGPESSWQNQAAKAVTPPVAEYLARCVRKGLELNIPTSNKVSVMDWRPLTKELTHVNKALLK